MTVYSNMCYYLIETGHLRTILVLVNRKALKKGKCIIKTRIVVRKNMLKELLQGEYYLFVYLR